MNVSFLRNPALCTFSFFYFLRKKSLQFSCFAFLLLAICFYPHHKAKGWIIVSDYSQLDFEVSLSSPLPDQSYAPGSQVTFQGSFKTSQCGNGSFGMGLVEYFIATDKDVRLTPDNHCPEPYNNEPGCGAYTVRPEPPTVVKLGEETSRAGRMRFNRTFTIPSNFTGPTRLYIRLAIIDNRWGYDEFIMNTIAYQRGTVTAPEPPTEPEVSPSPSPIPPSVPSTSPSPSSSPSTQPSPSPSPSPSPFSCTGANPDNASLCSDDDTNLPSNLDKNLVAVCGAPKCEYTCNLGYNYDPATNSCVPQCLPNYECSNAPDCNAATCGQSLYGQCQENACGGGVVDRDLCPGSCQVTCPSCPGRGTGWEETY